jgi:type IV pilus assembly protein PilW
VKRHRGFNLLEVMVAMSIGLVLVAAFLVVLQRSRRDFVAAESLSSLQDTARHALAVLVSDIEHAGFYGFTGAGSVRLVRGAATLAQGDELSQPSAASLVPAVAGLPPGAHDCGTNFAVDLLRAVQGSDNGFAFGPAAKDCAPTASAGGAAALADTLTLRHASPGTVAPRAGRLQVYSAARNSTSPLLLFADGRAPGVVDGEHEIRDLEVHSYYIANDSVGRGGWPALRVKSLTESRGAAQFRDEEVMPGVEDLQVEFGVAQVESGATVVRFVTADSPRILSAAGAPARLVALRVWLRVRADLTEPGHLDDRTMTYANVSFTPSTAEARQRRLLVSRTVALRNVPPG